jgi:gliding motility-associated-like protein
MTKFLRTTIFLLCSIWTSNSYAHSVQVAYCMNAAGELTLFVEHWHNNEAFAGATMTISYVTGGNTITTTGPGVANHQNVTLGTLPGCAQAAISFASCPGDANTENDWLEFNFGVVPCGVSVQLIVEAQANPPVFTQDGCGMYPATTGIITLPCPINQITEPDQTVCSGEAFNAIEFDPQPGVVYNWVNDNPAIGVPASGAGDIGVFTPPLSAIDQVANFTVTYFLDPNDVYTTTFTLTALATPVANFSVSTYCEGFDATIADLSTNTTPPINSWSWNFGDGSPIVTAANPGVHSFPGVGPYNIELTVSNGSCTDDIIIVASGNPLPVANFSSPAECEGTVTSFIDASTIAAGSITGYEWDFTHNGTVNSTLPNPTNGYPSAGSYTAELIVTSDQGCQDSIEVPVLVNPMPVVDFIFNEICDYETTLFTNQTTISTPGNIANYSWDFGDATGTSVLEDPTYAYGAAGAYTVTLTATTNMGCVDITTELVNVYPKPTADFTFADVCNGNDVNFVDNSNGNGSAITNYCWDIDANFTCEATTATFDYQYGSFGMHNANLIVTTQYGCLDTASYAVEIFEIPLPSFTWQNECENDAVSFVNTSVLGSGNITGFSWDFDDLAIPASNLENPTETYTTEGLYDVNFEITSANGCTAAVTETISIFPTPIPLFSVASVCEGVTTNFVDLSTVSNTSTSNTIVDWTWDLGEPGVGGTNIIFNGQNASHLYSTDGTYPVTLTVITNNSCENTFSIDVTVSPLPVPSFTSPAICEGTVTSFTDASSITSGTITGYEWDFTHNGAINSTVTNPTFGYPASGSYTTELILTSDQGCQDSIELPVVVNPVPVAGFLFDEICDYENTTFVNQTTVAAPGNITDYSWDFGDLNGTSIVQDPIYSYGVAGTYTVTLTSTTNHGCIDNTTEIVNVYPKPTADFTFTDVCLGNDMVFVDNSTGNGTAIADYCWDMDANFTCEGAGPGFNYQHAAYGVYNPNLIITTQYGCLDTISYPVEIFEIPTPNFAWQNECENQAVSFVNTSVLNTGTITDYTWSFDDPAIPGSILENPMVTYVNEGFYDVNLEVASINGCSADITQTISIFPTPMPSFSVGDVCNGSITNFTDLSTVSNTNTNNSVVSWTWDLGVPGSGGTNVLFNGQNASYLYSSEGTFPVTLTVVTNNLCENSFTYDAVVNPNPLIDFSSPNPDGCHEWCVDFTNNSTITIGAISSYFWEFNNGETSIMENPSSCFENTTFADLTYDITLTAVSDQGCSSTMTNADMVIVYPIPVADFIPAPPVSDIYNTTFEFIDNSTIADLYVWNVADLESFTDQDIQYTFSDLDSGTYEICLNVETTHGCVHDTCKTVYIEGYSNLYVANAFTPDGDLVNDYFKPSLFGFSPTNYEFMVFNRWGELIFITNNIDDVWDGTKSGTSGIVQQDVYVWKVKAIDKYTNEIIDLIGHVTLIK